MDLLNIFRQNIDLDTYKQMLREVFKADVLLDNSHIEELPAITDDDKGYYIGNKRTSDRYNIGFFYYEIGRSNVARKKVGLRNLVHKFINSRDGQFDAALVAFKGANHWRLSFICDIQDEATAPKRFTFVFGDADSLYRTPIERFGKLQQKGLNKTNIQDAFSVEALNDQFFADYKAHYEAFVEFITGKRFVKEDGEWVEKVMHNPHPTIYPQFKCDDKSVRDYVKQMMGRIVFLHFLQKKGWMGVPADAETWEGGDQNFMFKLFQCATLAQKNDFLDTVLEPLFFECLNTERERDIYVTPVEAIGKVRIPYLNGELFEKTELDKTECKFDVKLFENLFNLFNSYNFTIDENDPSDAEIGVDPEMLGKIFENLLEDNKDKGAFYTPKEIVCYMCKESLIAYLQSKFGKSHHDSIRTLVNTHLKDQHLEEDKNVCKRLNKALCDVKVCDPAIGSGAFPMGLLNEIFACRCQLETSDKPKSELKGQIIQNNIYGVDIERGAVDIARLRFWLALIVDAEKPVPLPNLDYKIMQGNSLLESYKGQDFTKFMENAFAQPYAIQLNKDLKKYFKETNNDEKLRLRKSIDYTIKQCIFQCGIQDEIELPNTEFFLWHTYFKDVFDEGGFDIVIGNPPYVLVQTLNDENLEQIYRRKFNVASYKIDLYHLFIEHGYNILKEEGVLSYITPSNFLTNNYTQPLRDLLLNKTEILSIINIGDNVFEAKVNTCIELIRKSTPKGNLNYLSASYDGKALKIELLSSVSQNTFLSFEKHMIQPVASTKSLVLCNKIAKKGDLLKNHATVNFGMQLRNRKIYTNDVLVSPSIEYLTSDHRKCLTGKDIFDYISIWNERYCYFNEEARCGGCWAESVHNAKDKIVVRQVGATPICGIDSEGLAVLNSAFMIVCKDVDPYGILGLLNSKLIKYYWCEKFEDKRKTFPKIKGAFLELIPIISPDDRIIKHVHDIIHIKITKATEDSISLQTQIDRLVYELYGLTNGEVKIIDPNETTVGSDDDLFKA